MSIKDILVGKSQADYVAYGYGQVEPNHLSAQRTGQIYAQLPVSTEIKILENGQFVKYDYAEEEVNFEGKGEWMLVFNEVKLYRDEEIDPEFAMIADDYQARIYSPYNGAKITGGQSRYYGGKDAEGNPIEPVAKKEDWRELDYNNDPYHFEGKYEPKKMVKGSMVPRVFKTNVGDIMTTNTISFGEGNDPAPKDVLKVNRKTGILTLSTLTGEGIDLDPSMEWQIVKVYTMPYGDPGVKIMRIK